MPLSPQARRRLSAIAAASMASASLLGASAAMASAEPGAVFTQTNAASGNAVLSFDRAADGSLVQSGFFRTGGLGSGAGLGSQGAVVVARDDVLAVDAGSGDLAALRSTRRGLKVVDREPAGIHPISVGVHGALAYVLDDAGSGQLLGFRVRAGGGLKPIRGSARPLSPGAAGPAEVAFTPSGHQLAVTEKTTNRIDIYRVGPDGRLDGPVVNASAGATPFGFAFDPAGHLIASEAGASTASSYRLAGDGTLSTISATIPTLQGAACWVAVTPDGRYAYTGNGAGNVTGFGIGACAPTACPASRARPTTSRSAPTGATSTS